MQSPFVRLLRFDTRDHDGMIIATRMIGRASHLSSLCDADGHDKGMALGACYTWSVLEHDVRLAAYATRPLMNDMGGMMFFPSLSSAGRMSTVARRVTIVAKRLCSARCLPGHILLMNSVISLGNAVKESLTSVQNQTPLNADPAQSGPTLVYQPLCGARNVAGESFPACRIPRGPEAMS
jgi:hypothetical protein